MMEGVFSSRLRAFFQQGLDLLFPPPCVGCGRGGSLLCVTCRQTIQPFTSAICQICGTPVPPGGVCLTEQYIHTHLHGLRALALYQGVLRQTIRALKYTGQRRLAEPLGLLLAGAFRHYQMRADAIIPLPLHAQRERQRGYNQATLLARVCATELRLPCLEQVVTRRIATKAQVGLTLTERHQNVAHAFALTPGTRLSPRYQTLLLIDDVCTTGATLAACAAPLYAAGISEVWGLVLARPGKVVQDV